MPPTPPVPAVTITTDPATPVDMSLATGEEQQVALHFSRSLIWSDFIENTRFTFMYDGQIHSDVAPVTGGGGVRIDGDDGELLIDIPEWSVPSSDVNITLELGHKDWVLLGITYDDRYQLKPQDLIGLRLENGGDYTSLGNDLISGRTVSIIYNNRLTQGKIENNIFKFKFVECNPAETNNVTKYYIDENYTVNRYACSLGDPSNIESDVVDYLYEVMGITVNSAEYLGDMASVPIPTVWCEH